MENIRRYPTNYDTNKDDNYDRQSTVRNTQTKSECGYRDLNPGDWLGKPIS